MGGQARSVSNNKFPSVTLNELAIKASEDIIITVISSFNTAVDPKIDTIQIGSK